QARHTAMIDSHIHVVPPGLPGVGSLSPLLEWPHEARALALRQEMIAAGVDQVFAMGCSNSGAQDPLGIVATVQMARTVPRLACCRHRRPDAHRARTSWRGCRCSGYGTRKGS